MVLLVACVALVWRSAHEPGVRPRNSDRLSVWGVRLLLVLGAVTLVAGTLATAAGPHAGGSGTGDEVVRLDWFGAETMDWAIHQHGALATFLGLAAVGVWFLVRARRGGRETMNALTAVCVLLACQGLVGSAQYAMELPATMVWIHVVLAALTWLALLWATAAAGRLAPRGTPPRSDPPPDPAPRRRLEREPAVSG
jgi:cytochrome c oxidase assembly protein subunit 15